MTVDKIEYATFAGGCFWCVESCFAMLKGVESVQSGYSGGHTENPTYEDVCTDTTGHAEVVNIAYKPNEISFTTLMQAFLTLHNPTELNRQGEDVGTQYRSAVFYHSAEQREIAIQCLNESEQRQDWFGKYVTEVVEFTKFWTAEDYHQAYFVKNPQRACDVKVAGKIHKFKQKMHDYLKPEFITEN